MILNDSIIKKLGISDQAVKKIIENETAEMNRRISLYRKDLPELDLGGKTVIIIDDGIATGVSTQAAVTSIKSMNPAKIILAVPVCPADAAGKFKQHVDEFICLNVISDFYAVGLHYDSFNQVTDEEVVELLQRAKIKD